MGKPKHSAKTYRQWWRHAKAAYWATYAELLAVERERDELREARAHCRECRILDEVDRILDSGELDDDKGPGA